MTDESRDNITRAPDGTSFYCVTEPNGRTHCAASTNMGDLAPEERSRLGGAEVAPITPDGRGTGHQQVARRVGVEFDEASARVGYVEGEGYGSSLHKRDACNRDYTFRSAFNAKTNPYGSRQMPTPMAQRFEAGMEAAFPPCPCEATDPTPEDSA